MDESTSPWAAVGGCLLGAVGVFLLAGCARALISDGASLRIRAITLSSAVSNPLIAFMFVAAAVALIAAAQEARPTPSRWFLAAVVLSVIVAALMLYAAFEVAVTEVG